ncbi:hypothetical protein BJ508DRAFT_371917 [Ascobolus immersus RN42]|uniref:SAP domain-containing protein n=1 Tax=Ascobolus immersus RN42 TaxID=1160509 RepID=A0A3N4ITU6_ASCIM|nr:hypothetical protein BJ508DRAFT_371917 [Ascobolus immersus RN42]
MQLEPVNKLTAYTSVYLRGLCKEYGIPHTGGRTELIERLREFIEGELEREQNQSQSLVETTPTRSPVEPVPSVRSSTVEKNVEKTPGDDAQSRLARNRKRPIRKPPASFFTDPPIRLFAVAVEIPVRPKESSDYENLSNGADVETIESSDVEVPSDDEESQSEPELPAPETRQQQTAIRGRPIGGGRGSRGRGRGRGQSRGRNGQTSRGGRTTRSSTRELEAEQKDSDTEVETKVRTPTPIPESPVRTKDTVTKPVDDQAIPTPPKEEDDVEMEDTSLVESVEEDPQEAQPQNTHPNQTTTGDTIDIKQKETDTTFDGTETPAPSRIPATDYTRPPDPEEHLNDRQAAEPTNESKASEPSAETSVQIAEESVVSPAHEDVHMKDADAAQPVAVQAL